LVLGGDGMARRHVYFGTAILLSLLHFASFAQEPPLQIAPTTSDFLVGQSRQIIHIANSGDSDTTLDRIRLSGEPGRDFQLFDSDGMRQASILVPAGEVTIVQFEAAREVFSSGSSGFLELRFSSPVDPTSPLPRLVLHPFLM